VLCGVVGGHGSALEFVCNSYNLNCAASLGEVETRFIGRSKRKPSVSREIIPHIMGMQTLVCIEMDTKSTTHWLSTRLRYLAIVNLWLRSPRYTIESVETPITSQIEGNLAMRAKRVIYRDNRSPATERVSAFCPIFADPVHPVLLIDDFCRKDSKKP